MAPLAGINADIWITATPSLTATNESCTDSGDHINYQAATHIFWDWTQTFTVQNSPNGSTSWVTVTDYVMQWASGKIVFNTARTNTFTRIATGNYFTATQMDATHMWTLTTKGAVVDTTSFQATGGWSTYTPTIKSASGSFQTYRNDDRIFKEIGNMLGMQCFIDKANNIRMQFFATVTGVTPKSDVKSVQEQAITFDVVRDIYYLTT